MIFLEGLLRFLPGVIGRSESVEHDSFTGPFVDYPEYTEPVTWHDRLVPEIVRSGNHGAIARWRSEQAAQKTIESHFDWFRTRTMTEQEKKLGVSCIPPHYAVLMHADVIIKDQGGKKEGTTSVTSFDIHDIARSARTYGLKDYFIVTKLVDQQKVVQRLLEFWKTDVGLEYNPERFEAVSHTHLATTLDEVIKVIEVREGKRPVLVATSAREGDHAAMITYHDQNKVWTEQRPVLFIFGTGRGLTEQLLQRCDFLLGPVKGFSDFNHLSVRSAAAVIFDRWLGWNPKNVGGR
jgi:tRNA (guanine37-N1)-methyltransferase